MRTLRPGLLVVQLGALESWGAEHDALLDQLPGDEQVRIRRYRRDADRYRSLAAALLPRLLIVQRSQQSLGAIRFERSPAGKPFYPADPGFHFNLSHSGDYVALAIDSSPVGVDVEQLRPTRDWDAIARRFFTADEQRWLASFDEAERRRRFIALWSRKESLLKATGEGIAGGLNSFSAIADNDTTIAIGHRGQTWFLRSYGFLPGYGLALCCASADLPQLMVAQAQTAHLFGDIEPEAAMFGRKTGFTR